MKRGFTLIEISIVMVVIGLAVGTTVTAQSMIHTAKIQKVIRQLSQYDAAISNFRLTYNNLPGKSHLFPCTICDNGQGGGTLWDMSGYNSMNAWAQLSLGSGLKNKKGNDYEYLDPFDPSYSDANCPNFDIDEDNHQHTCLFIDFADFQFGETPTGVYRYQETQMGIAATYDPMLPSDAAAIDIKLDDGNAVTGHVVSVTWGTEVTPPCNNGPNYNLTNNYGCTIDIDIGRSNGMDSFVTHH